MMENKEVEELINKLDEAKDYLIYVMMENKAEKQLLNNKGVAALMFLRDDYSLPKVDEFIRDLSKYLDSVRNKYNIS